MTALHYPTDLAWRLYITMIPTISRLALDGWDGSSKLVQIIVTWFRIMINITFTIRYVWLTGTDAEQRVLSKNRLLWSHSYPVQITPYCVFMVNIESWSVPLCFVYILFVVCKLSKIVMILLYQQSPSKGIIMAIGGLKYHYDSIHWSLIIIQHSSTLMPEITFVRWYYISFHLLRIQICI